MKCQILSSGKNKKNITSLLSAKLAQRVVRFFFSEFLLVIGHDIHSPGNGYG